MASQLHVNAGKDSFLVPTEVHAHLQPKHLLYSASENQSMVQEPSVSSLQEPLKAIEDSYLSKKGSIFEHNQLGSPCKPYETVLDDQIPQPDLCLSEKHQNSCQNPEAAQDSQG